MGDNGSSYSKIESIWSNAVRLTRSVYPNLQDEIEYIEANLGGGNISCNCSALEFAIENLSTIKLSRDGSQPMEGELVCNNGLKTDIIKARTQSIIDCQNQLRVYQSLGGDGDSGLWLGSDFSFGAPSINLYPYSSSANGKIFIRTPRSSGFSGVRVEIPGKNDFIDIKIKDSNLIPYDDNYQDLGSSSKRWKNIYAVSGNFSGVIIPDEIISNADDIANLSLIKLSRDGSQPMTGILTCQSGIKTNSLTTVSGDIVTCEKDLVVNSHIWGNPLLTIGGGAGFTDGYPHIKFSYNDLILLTPGESGPLERIFIYGGWDDGEIMIKNADLAPFTDNRWDLGFPGYTWRCVYAAKGNFSGTIIPDAILTNSANISDLDARVDYLEENLSSNVSCNCSALEYSIQNLSENKLSRDGSQPMEGELVCNNGLKTNTVSTVSGDTLNCEKYLEINKYLFGKSLNGLWLFADHLAWSPRIELDAYDSGGGIRIKTCGGGVSLVPRIDIPGNSDFVDIKFAQSNLIPYDDNQQNLGNSNKRWKNIYAVSSLFSNVQVEFRIWSNNTFTIGYSNSTTENSQIRLTSTDLTLMTPNSNGTSTERLSLTGNADRSIVYIKNAHLLPYDNLSSYLGSTAHRWLKVFADTGSFTKIDALSASVLDVDDDVKLDRRLWGKNDLILAGGDPSYGHAQIKLYNKSNLGHVSLLSTDSSGVARERVRIEGDQETSTIIIKKANIEPYYDNTYRLGSSGYRWSDIYAVNTHWGDLGFVETTCPKCNKKFKIGDNIILKVVRFNEEDGGIMTIPIHLECAKLPTKTIRKKYPVKEKYYEWDERQGRAVVKWRTKKQKKKIKKKRLKSGYKINQKTGKIESINRKHIDLSEAVEEVEEEIEEIVYQEKEIKI